MAPITFSEKTSKNRLIKVLIFTFIVLLWISGCSGNATEQPPALADSPYITILNCTEIVARTGDDITCRPVRENTVLVQTDSQHVLEFNGPSVTFDATVFLEADPGTSLVVAVLDGTAIISSGGISRVINSGLEVLIPLDNGLSSTFAPLEPETYSNDRVQSAPLGELPNSITLNTPVPSSTPSPTPRPTDIIPTTCPRPDSWSETYTIQRGDNLTSIANAFEVSITELQQFNCISNPNRIRPGDVLFVPGEEITATPQELPPAFWVDNNRLLPSTCTMIHWVAEGGRLVYFQSEPVSRSADLEICPVATTKYTLSVIQPGGEQLDYSITVTVISSDD